MKKHHKNTVRPKKQLGQHFLVDPIITLDIIQAFELFEQADVILEIGPGMGVLSEHLITKYGERYHAIELDRESIHYLKKHYPSLGDRLIHHDVLRFDFELFEGKSIAIIGNFPYNISSQIIFKVLENKENIIGVVGMFQKEVAQRLCAPPNNKIYGIQSVLLQAYFDRDYLFDLGAEAFDPAPNVQSGVIRLTRNGTEKLDCDEQILKKIVKRGFQNRRKTLRNALKSLNLPPSDELDQWFSKRAEQLSVEDFISLTNYTQQHGGII